MKAKVVVVIVLIISVISVGKLWAYSKGKITILKRIDVNDAYTPKVLGLFIGIQEYKDPFWHDLKYPKKDVQDMVDFFTNNPTIELDYKMVLTRPEDTTRDTIFNNRLDEFKMKNSSEKDIVIVYISSHGTLTKELVTIIEDGELRKEPRKVPYILTSDSHEGKVTDSALALGKIIEWFEKLKSRQKVLILDMCHSGDSGKSQLSPDQAAMINSAKGISFTPFEDSRASIILSACPIGGTSFEDKTLENSVYTHFLLEGMNLGDLNGDGAVSISEAHNYSIDKTRQYTWEHKKYKQVPTSYSTILGKDPIFVSGNPVQEGMPTLFSYSSANQEVEIYLDDLYQGMLPKGISVDPGQHKIVCKRDGRKIYSEKINITFGHDYMLPYFEPPGIDKKNSSYFILEGAYRNFYRDQVEKKLTPSIFTGGFSLYHYGFITKWLGLSGGFDYGRNKDLEQYSGRLGIKATSSWGNTSLSIGPDFMFMFFRYASDTLAGKKLDKEMTFFCPGAEVLLAYKFKPGLIIALGARAHYVPYSLDAATNNIVSQQGFAAVGYSF